MTAPTLALRGAGPRSQAYGAAAVAAGWRVADGAARDTDAVALCEPGGTVDEVLAVLASGRAVLVEPSWCRTPAQAEHVIDASRRANRAVLHAEHFAYAPVFDALLRWLGRIGVPHHLEVRHLAPHPDDGSPAPTAITLAVLAARRAGLGEIVTVDPAMSRSGPGNPATITSTVTIGFASGVEATVVAGTIADTAIAGSVRTLDVQVASAEGVLRAELAPMPSLEHNGDTVDVADPDTDPPELGWSGLVGQFLALRAAMAHGAAPLTDPALAGTVCDVVVRAFSRADDPSR